MKKIPLIIDADPGLDDSAAVIMAIMSNKFDVKLLASNGGNVDVKSTTRNLLLITQLLNKDIPVVQGYNTPLDGTARLDASFIYAESGLGDIYKIPTVKKKPLKQDVVSAIKKVFDEVKQKIAILTLGPCTNIVAFLIAHPEYKSRIETVYMMGGSLYGKGNKVYTGHKSKEKAAREDQNGQYTPLAEFNFLWDPEAAHYMLTSGIPLVIAPVEIGNNIRVCKNAIKDRVNSSNPIHKFITELYLGGNEPGFPDSFCQHDTVLVAHMLKKGLFKTKKGNFVIETDKKKETYGQSFAQWDKKGKHTFIMDVPLNTSKIEKFILKQLYK